MYFTVILSGGFACVVHTGFSSCLCQCLCTSVVNLHQKKKCFAAYLYYAYSEELHESIPLGVLVADQAWTRTVFLSRESTKTHCLEIISVFFLSV